KRVLSLPVSGPFHSELMIPASEKLQSVLDPLTFSDAAIPVVTNVDGEEKRDANELKSALISQVYSTVEWEKSIRNMIDQGVDTITEFGSGKVLTVLVRTIDRNCTTFNVFDHESLQNTVKDVTAGSGA